MSKTICKYEIHNGKETHIAMPSAAKVVHADVQEGHVFIWAEVDTEANSVLRKFSYFGTGHDIPKNAVYIGTVFQGEYVWHIYEIL